MHLSWVYQTVSKSLCVISELHNYCNESETD